MFRTSSGSKVSVFLLAVCWLATPLATAQEGKKPAEKPQGKAPIQVGVADKETTGELPEMTTAIGQRAALAFSKKDWATARKLYKEVLELDPENALTLANLGAVTFQLGKYEAAQSYLEKAVAQNPKLVQARITLGMVYYNVENYYMAISHLCRAVHDDPDNARAHMYFAVVAKQVGWNGAAEEELRKAIAADPKHPDAHYNLALIYIDQNPPAIELARRHYLRALELGAQPDSEIADKIK
jgi:tetratricopeptide (TPR) repeat protein